MATSSASLAQDIIRSQPPFGGRRGSVVRLAFKDFLSFKAVELYSGSDLNIVLGPTADEQSIIVYALCLCLGGTPTVTGLEEFIRDGSDSTSIEVELFNPEGFNFIVRRCIAKTSHFTSSEYLMRPANSLFLVPVTITEVTNLMHDLKIQLGSMNQFLSQEVLQDFVGMNSFSLLQNTQKALGNDTLYQQHEKLIELTAKLREIEGNLHTHMNHLKSRQQLTKRMENDVKNYKASEDLKAKIAELASKKSWIVYLKSREVFLNLKTELETVKKAKTLEEAKLAPIKQSLKAIDSKKTKFQAELERSKATNESFMNLVRRKVEEEFDKVETNVDEENAKLREHQNAEADRLKRVENFTVKVNACEKQLDEIRQKGDMDDTRLNAELSRLHKQLKKRDEEILEITNLDEKDESNRRYILSKIRTAETNLSQMNDLRVSRMKYLEKEVPHVYEAVQFYSKPENLVHFKGRIHEPLVLHIEVNDLEYGRIVEKHIGIAELNGFFVEHEDDLEVMLELNRKRKKRVTVTHFEGPKTVPFQRPPSQYSKEFMQKWDFKMSILDLIGGPDYYLAYLCQRFHMQNILIGDDKADRMATEISEQTPVNIYYTNRRCVTIRQSNYSKSKAMQFSVIQAARVLTTKINATEKHNLHENVKQWRIEEKELEDLINGRKRRKAEVDEERQAIDDNVRDINARIQFVMNLLEKRATVWKDLNQVQTERENLDYVDVRFNAAEKYNIHENVKKWRQEETRLEAIINGRQWRMQLEDERSTTSKYNVRDYSACIQHRMNVLERLGSVRKEIQMLQLEEKNLDNLELNDDVAVLDIRMKLLHVTEFVAHDLVKAQWNAYKPIVLRKKIRLLNARMEHLQNQLDEMQGDVRQFEAKVSVLQLQVEQAAKEAETNKKGVVQVSNLHEPPPEVAAGELNDEAVEKESLQANTQLGFCMETDPKVVREYQEKMREIADLTKQKDVGEKKLAEVKEDIVTKKQAWLNPLQELIGTVNKNFGRYFTSMGCSGVVQLQKADDENDFAKYGIKILVKFRTSEPLSELGGTTGGNLQSGGERYISTALYILALQQVTPAPFRFIDEINQGMDVTNEARFFTVLCSLANEPSSPQCFVLTSKMIPPLDYPDNVDFHIIFSGPHVNVPLAIHSNADSSEDEGKED